MGWESKDFLQNALDTCQDGSGEIEACPLFNIQSDDDAAKCTFDMPNDLKDDNPQGPRNGLPVDVPIQYGPEEATSYKVAGLSDQPTSTIALSEAPSTFSHPTLTYSPADPKSTSTAQFGIVVAKVSPAAGTDSFAELAPAPAATTTPPYDPAVNSFEGFAATSFVTSGNTVMEIFVTEIDVTTTVTATASADSKRKRHLHRHLHGARG